MDHSKIKEDLSFEHKLLILRSRQIVGSKPETLLTTPQEKFIPCEEHHEIADFKPNCINCIHISLYDQLPIGMYLKIHALFKNKMLQIFCVIINEINSMITYGGHYNILL